MRGQRHAPAALTPGKDPVPTVQEAGWAPEPVWLGAENLALTGIRSADRPARSQSLYRATLHATLRSNDTGLAHTVMQQAIAFYTQFCNPEDAGSALALKN